MLEINRLNAWYGESHILHNLDLAVQSGGRVAVLGRNGAGKTTLFKSIMNGGPRVVGNVTWNGVALGKLPSFRRARLGLGIVPEDRRIFQHVTVAENIEMAKSATSPDRPAIPVAEILQRFAMLQPLAERYGGQLSGGQQQMLAVARAVAARPRLLLVDEPAEGLAPIIIEQLARDLRDVCQEQSMALLLAEQNVWFARQCTNELFILETGRIVFHGGWDEFDERADELQRHIAV